tara:strand:+ start:128 stop:442 length:315 start_codon:yes stop_codon:yes gene_type:complete
VKWEDNPLVWEKLDEYMINSAAELKELLDVLYEHDSEFHPMLKGLLFGGLGQLVMAYNVARTEANEPKLALALGIEKVMVNPIFGKAMAGNINNIIDNTVDKME